MNQSTQKPFKPNTVLKKKADLSFKKGESYFTIGQLGPAQEYFNNALNLYKESSDAPQSAQCQLHLGRVLELKGEYTRATQSFQESFQQFEALEDPNGISRCKASLGNVAWATGDYDEASNLFKESMASFQAIKDLRGLAWVYDLNGNLHLAMGRDQEAEQCHTTAFTFAKEMGLTKADIAWNHYHLAAVALFRCRLEVSRDLFLKALNTFSQLGDTLGKVATLIHLGEIACDLKEYKLAQPYFLKAVREVIPTQCRPILTDALTGVARLLKGQGEGRKALGLLMIALSHPTCRQQTKDRIVYLSKTLEAGFSPREFETGFQWAKAFTIEEMASAWLSAHSPKAKT